MERLTEKRNGKNVVKSGYIALLFNNKTGNIFEGEAIDKLAAYEDAEEQGLLLRLPCGIGTTVYEIENNTDACFKCDYFVNAYCNDCEDFCSNKDVRDDGDIYVHPQYADKPLCQKHFYEVNEYMMNNIDEIFNRRNDFGKSVFLSREEAEAKLAEMEDVLVCFEDV